MAIVVQMASGNLMLKAVEWKRLLNEIHKIIAGVAVESQVHNFERFEMCRGEIRAKVVT